MPTDAQHDALKRLHARGGEGVLDKHGKIVAAGERLMRIEPVTWLRLILTGHVEVRDHMRLGITKKGKAALTDAPTPKANPHGIRGESHPISPRHPGAE